MISKKFEIQNDPAPGRYITCLLAFVLICVVAINSEASYSNAKTKILLLPFHLSETDENRELITFKDYVDTKLRKSIEAAGDNYEIESKSAAAQLIANNAPPRTVKDIKELTAISDSDYVIFGSVSRRNKEFQFRGYMWQVRERRMVVSLEFSVAHVLLLARVLNEFSSQVKERLEGSPNLEFYPSQSPGLLSGKQETEFKPVSVKKDGGPWRSPNIPEALLSLDIGDMDGDKRNETVFLSKGQVSIRKFEQGVLKTLIRFSHPPVAYISAEVEDVDKDGAAELILCYQKPNRLESAIISYKNRNFEIAQTFPDMILSVIDDPVMEGERTLVAQRTDTLNMFDGSMIRMRIVDGKAVPGSRIDLPPGALLTSYVEGRLGNSEEDLRIILNQDQRLMVFDTENRLLASVPERIYGIDRRLSVRVGKEERTIKFPGRLAIADTNGDGVQELLVSKQTAQGSVVEDLVWEDGKLKQKWKTVGAQGIISDFRVRDFKNQGVRSLVLILVQSNPFPLMAISGPSSVVYAYELGR